MPSHNGRFIRYISPRPRCRLPKAPSLPPPLRRKGGEGPRRPSFNNTAGSPLAGVRKHDAPYSSRRAPRGTRMMKRCSSDARSGGPPWPLTEKG